ncbi:MAG: [protein-PII] uridylyltransferase [Hyphomonadaceae bacterium]|nr:[protein-PII] uridylyltransferase [Hyphomonadaceae bacterium]
MNQRTKPLLIQEAIDGIALRQALTAVAKTGGANVRGEALALLTEAWSKGNAVIAQRLTLGDNGRTVARLLAKLADEVVGALYDFTTVHIFRSRNPTQGERFAVMAVGGYGRGELAPYSDLDLLFLRAYKQTPWAESVTEYMLYMLWDMGLKVGNSSRTVDECLKLAKGDHTIQTSLLEMRHLCGDATLSGDLTKKFRKEIMGRNPTAFVAAKLAERDARHQKAGASRYMVEPNIKEGKGGLRDLHSLFWIARARYGFDDPREYVSSGVFSQEEAAEFQRAHDFLWTVRWHLHLIAGRAEERLTFDVQPELARRMGYFDRGNLSGVERFMKRYFLVAKRVGALTRVLCATLEADQAKRAPQNLQRLLPSAKDKSFAALPPGFVMDAGRLNAAHPQVFDDPINLLRVFQLADERSVDVHPAAIGEVSKRVSRINAAFRREPAAREIFLNIVASPRQPAAALALMNEAGVLGRFLPEFGRIVAQMQFNMYHHFTVDEHTLRGIAAISEIEKGRYGDHNPLATSLMPKIINRRALYLAMLLHDTGKGDGDQQIEGAKSARTACERLGLPEEEVELISWLVGHHLEMSDCAQKRDISDPRTVAQFVELVGSLEKLRLLLVLTVADIRAVGGGLWNDWKGQLLRDLYAFAEAAFRGGQSDEDSVRIQLAQRAAETRKFVLDHVWRSKDVEWVSALDDAYWLGYDREALIWQISEVTVARRRGAIPHVAARHVIQRGVTEVLIYAGDRPGLFASLATAIAASGADIADARIHTTRDGAAFDVFSVQTTDHRPFGLKDRRQLDAMVARLHRAALEDPVETSAPALPKRLSAFRIEPWVRTDNSLTPNATIIEASGRDRPGLLAALARVFAEAKINILSAHLGAYGERVNDVFYVQDRDGPQIVDPQRIAMIEAKLEEVLLAVEPPEGAASTPRAVARASTAR